MREAILQKTDKERKKWGINKSTLWYMQKNIRDGKRIKIYHKVKEKMGIEENIK